MDIEILDIADETPKGLSTGFRLKLACRSSDGKEFQLDMPLLIGKEVMAEKVPLRLLALHYLKKEGLAAWPDFFVDTRTFDLSKLPKTTPDLPHTLTLGGPEELNQRILAKITGP